MTPRLQGVWLLLALATLILSRTARADDTTPPPAPAKPEVIRLENGVRLVVRREPGNPQVVTDIFFLVGQADEKGQPGINALIAHAWGGESEYRSAALLRTDIARTGSIGTDFDSDWVELWGISGNDPSEIEKSFQTLFVNLVGNPRFTPLPLATTIREQQQEIVRDQDNPLTDVLDRLRARAFGGSPYSRPPLGDADRLYQIHAEDVSAYYARLFRPERCVIVVTGGVETETVRNLVTKSLGAGGWNEGSIPPPLPRIAPETIPIGLHDQGIARHAPATLFAAGLLAPGTGEGDREGYAALLLLDAVLGGGKSSRLFAALRDTQPIGYDVRTVLMPGRGQSLWVAYIVGDSPISTCRTALQSQIAAVADGSHPVTRTELDRARIYLKSRQLRERQRLRERAFGIGWSEAMGIGADFDTDYDARLDAVTLEAVNTMARRVLGGNAAIVYTLPPVTP